MVILLVFIAIVVWAWLSNKDFSLDWVWQLLAAYLFYWLGGLFAPVSAVLGFHFTLYTIIAAFFYCIAAMIVWMWIKVHLLQW